MVNASEYSSEYSSFGSWQALQFTISLSQYSVLLLKPEMPLTCGSCGAMDNASDYGPDRWLQDRLFQAFQFSIVLWKY